MVVRDCAQSCGEARFTMDECSCSYVCIVQLSYPSRGTVRARKRCRRNARKNTSAERVYYCWIGLGSEVLIAVIAWPSTRGLGLVGCNGDSVRNYSRVTTTNIESLFPALFPVRARSPAIYLSPRVLAPTSLAHPFLKSPLYPAPALVYHHLLSTTFTIKWPRNCDCFT